MKIITQAHILAKIAPFAETGGNRYFLQGIHIVETSAGGCYIIATDGHRMALYHDIKTGINRSKEEKNRDCIIRLSKEMVAACKRKSNANQTACIDTNANTLTIAGTTYGTQDDNIWIDADFPDWQSLLTNTVDVEPCNTIHVNADYLKSFGLGNKGAAITLDMRTPTSPILVRNDQYPEFLGLLMPRRSTAHPEHPALAGIKSNKIAA